MGMTQHTCRGPTLLGAMVLACGAAIAGPLDKSMVDREAAWVFHVDVEGAKTTAIGGFVTESIRADLAKSPDMAEIRALGIDPLTDILGVTVYGFPGETHDGVAVLSTTTVADALKNTIPSAQGVTGFETREENGVTYMTWTAHGHPAHAALRHGKSPDSRHVLFAISADRLNTAVSVMNGSRAALGAAADEKAADVLGASPREGSFIFAAARGLGDCPGMAPQAAAFRDAESLVLDMGETSVDGVKEIYIEASMHMSSPDMAVQVQQMVQGLLAMAVLSTQGQPELAATAGMARSVQVTADNTAVRLTSRHKSEDVISLLRSLEKLEHGGEVAPVADDSEPKDPAPKNPDGQKPRSE
jgi:hypothetical protein